VKRSEIRRTPMRSRHRPAVPPAVRRALAKRSGGECEMRLPGCWVRATDPCHRIGSQNGGRHGEAKVHHDRLSNLVHGCRACHSWCHDNPDQAEAMGLILRQHEVPEETPAVLRCELVYLDNDGGWTVAA
jgi:hypothetical protein